MPDLHIHIHINSESRRLQGLPTPSFGLFGGLSAEKLMGAWQEAIDDDPSKDLVTGPDGVRNWGGDDRRADSPTRIVQCVLTSDCVFCLEQVQRWPEYVYVGNNTKCFICGMAPYPSSSHVNPDATQLPLPLTSADTTPGTCDTSDACAEGAAPQDTISLLATAEAASPEPLALPGKLAHFQRSKVSPPTTTHR